MWIQGNLSLNFCYRTDFGLHRYQLVFLSLFRVAKQVRGIEKVTCSKILVRDKPFALFRGWKDHITSTLKTWKSSSSLSVNSHCTQCIPTVCSFLSPVIGIHCDSDHNEFQRDLCGHHICFPRNSVVMQHYYNVTITPSNLPPSVEKHHLQRKLILWIY